MVFKSGQVEWSVPLKALDESIQQLTALFIFDLSSESKASTHALFPIRTFFVVISWLLTLGGWPENLQSSAVYATEQLHWSSCLRAPQQRLMSEDRVFFHFISVLSEDWDPADQSHEQITINKLNGESLRLGVLENNDERQAFKREKTLNKKQEPINCTIQPSALQIYSRLRRPLFTESVYHTCALLSTGEMLHVSQ